MPDPVDKAGLNKTGSFRTWPTQIGRCFAAPLTDFQRPDMPQPPPQRRPRQDSESKALGGYVDACHLNETGLRQLDGHRKGFLRCEYPFRQSGVQGCDDGFDGAPRKFCRDFASVPVNP